MLLARFLDPWIPIALAALFVSAAIVSAGWSDVRELFRPAPSRILIGLLGAAIMLAATYGLFPLVARRVPALALETGNLYATFLTGRRTVTILLFVIPVIVAEELMWRGAFQEWIAQRLPASRLAIIVLAAAGYAIAHLPLGSPLLVGIAFLCGLYWSALRSLTRSVVPSLIAHLAWDLALILVPLNR
jgi:membrane protease YdiL (CAAX protease family)